jgi:hypothetical protein
VPPPSIHSNVHARPIARDPLPWQIQAMLRNDSGEPVLAIAAAREALTRLPYLKSLNPLASDSQGSANLGKALGDFGMEHWARAYASASYYPLVGGQPLLSGRPVRERLQPQVGAVPGLPQRPDGVRSQRQAGTR